MQLRKHSREDKRNSENIYHLPSDHEVMSQARLTSQIATILLPPVSRPFQKCGDPFLVFYVQIYLFAIHVVSKSHNACLAKLIAMQRAGVIEESQFPLPVGWGTRLFSALPHFLAQLLFGSYWWKVSAIHEKQRPFNWANGANYKGNVVKISFLN